MARAKVIAIRPSRAVAPRPLDALWSPLPLFLLLLACELALHASLLRLPYFWDEAGYYVPAARDLLLRGDLIPQFSNAHPPLVMAWLALVWKLFGFHEVVTRTAMLAVAAFALVGVFRLAYIALAEASARAAREVALAATACTALYPVFFAQSSQAQVDLAAAAFTVWALSFYVEGRRAWTIAMFALAGLAKETAVLAPVALCAWEVALYFGIAKHLSHRAGEPPALQPKATLPAGEPPALQRSLTLLIALLPLAAWFAYHYHRTGYVFGNPEYVRYNLSATLHPARVAGALLIRLWHLLGYLNLFVLTIAAAMAMTLAPQREFSPEGNGHGGAERARIPLPIQAAFGVVILAYVVALSIVGGAALARYLLPVYPLVIILCVSTLRRRLPWWHAFAGVVCLGFVIALVTNPPYRFAPEDNLDYAAYVRLHQSAARVLEARFPDAVVLTAWPASDELMKPFLGYVTRPERTLAIDNFAADQILLARQERGRYDAVFAFSTKYEPRLLLQLPFWEKLQERYFGYHHDLPPEAIAEMLNGRLVYVNRAGGQWVAVINVEHAEEAERR